SPCRNALPAAHPTAKTEIATRSPRPRICNLRSAVCTFKLASRQANRLPASPVKVRHLNGFHPDVKDPVLPEDRSTFETVNRRPSAAIAENRDLLASGLCNPDEFQRDRRWRRRSGRYGRQRLLGWGRSAFHSRRW